MSAEAGVRPASGQVSESVLRQLPARVKRVRSGMTREQVWSTVGLSGVGLGGRGSGPPQAFEQVYAVGPYHLDLVFDDTLRPGRLKSARLTRSR